LGRAISTFPGGQPAIAFEGIHFSYGLTSDTRAGLLDGLDLDIPESSFSMLCGSNGSGKSTLLQMANGLIEPDKGRVSFKGRPLAIHRKNRGSIHSKVALLFQNPERQLFSETVFDDIGFGPRNLGLRTEAVRRRVFEAAEWVGLKRETLDRPVHTLSGGQMRRAAIAGVLAMDPEVLVLDEPTDGLDPQGVMEFFKRAHEYCRNKGTTILMAAHKVPDQVWLIDHFGHLLDGRIRSSGPPGRVLARPERTIPAQYLPDHLLLQEELLSMGVHLDGMDLDPVRVEGRLLALVDLSRR
jgi:energy-coupling factor transport system ATP-binding protein